MSARRIPTKLSLAVRKRALEQCEYCCLPQWSQEATFHVDHIQPLALGGSTHLENLALACVSCSLRKAARQNAVDPLTGRKASLFHPRVDDWNHHFAITKAFKFLGKTPQGRATLAALRMNRPAIIQIRKQLALLGKFPPK